ncbi:MAG: FeoB-associated Cys-rich membrane protein [Clostridia bacterium]|nr:FeoB-associated Cys-rich membrane protein [Clostridia bacterium]
MTDIIIVLVLLVVIGLAAGYVIKAKKSGSKCIGCPEGSCPHRGTSQCSCGSRR